MGREEGEKGEGRKVRTPPPSIPAYASGTDSRALRAEYCIVGIPHNTNIWFIIVVNLPSSDASILTLELACHYAMHCIWTMDAMLLYKSPRMTL